MTAVRIDGLVKKYAGLTVVDNLSLDIADGEFIVLLGPSGCGKTTTLRCVAGLEDIDGGQIRFGDELVSKQGYSMSPEKRRIGMVFQSYAIWPHLTVFENVAFPLRLQKRAADDIARRVDSALELVGLGGFAARGAHQLSGGQLQRVALARAVVGEPRVLLFDEPLSNLDAALRERMRFELRNLHDKLGITSIYVTHDQQEAMAIADRIVLLNGGKVVQVDSPKVLYKAPADAFVARFIGGANILDGVVIGAGASAAIDLGKGKLLYANSSKLKQGDRVQVAVRPEQITLSKTQESDRNTFAARVARNTFLGTSSDLAINLDDLELRAQASPPAFWEDQEEVWVHISPEAVLPLGSN